MNRGTGSLLTPDDTGALELAARHAPVAARRRSLRRALAGFGGSCALVGLALLGCFALVAIGTIGSLAWTLIGQL